MAADVAGQQYLFSPLHAVTLAGHYVFAFCLALVAYAASRRLQRQGEEARKRFYAAIDVDDKEDSAATGLSIKARNVDIFDESNLFQYDSAGYILKYNHKNSIASKAALCWKHTIAVVPAMSRRIMVSMAIACIAFAIDASTYLIDAVSLNVNTRDIQDATKFFNSFIGMLLAFYLSKMLSRWWDMRNSTLGRLWGAVDDLCVLMPSHLPGREWCQFRKLVLRYCLLSYELTFMQAQGEDASVDELVEWRLLTEDEADMLRNEPSKPQVVWAWVAGMFSNAHRQGRICNVVLRLFYTKCMDARGGIGATFAYLDTQLPFMYVHLLACLVHAANLIAAMDAGTSAAHYVMDSTDVGGQAPKPTIRLLQVVLQTFFYNAVLEIGQIFSDPLGTDFEDFPRHAWHCFMRNECEAFLKAGELPTTAMRKAADAAGVPQGSPYAQIAQKAPLAGLARRAENVQPAPRAVQTVRVSPPAMGLAPTGVTH